MASRLNLSNNKKRKIKVLLADAFVALQQHEHGQCEQHCQAIQAIQASNADANYLLGILARDRNQPEQSETYFKQAIATSPKRIEFITALAGLYLSMGAYEKALPVYQQALSLEPHDTRVLTGLAGVMVCLERYDEAIPLLETAKKQRPGNIDIRMGLFQANHDCGRIEQARDHLQDILKRDSSNAKAFYNLSVLNIESGDLAAGKQAIRQAIKHNPGYTEAYIVLADLQRFTHNNDDVLAMLKLHKRCPERSIKRMNMAFALSKAYDDIAQADQEPSRFDTAFDFMQEANNIRRNFSRYDEPAILQQMQQLMLRYTSNIPSVHSTISSTQPVFILGMPRSGTTLVEQILAAHPKVHVFGENAMLNQAMATISHSSTTDPLNPTDWTDEQCRAVGEAYLSQLNQQQPIAQISTDKTLSHIIHIGSIARFLPHAKIIHVCRNALDTCLSIYKNNIIGSQYDYGHNLTELGHYYRAYEQLMTHWKKILPDGMLIEIDYEQLVSDSEQQSKKLIHACGLPWHSDCLDFQHANNRVLTASMTQVRLPIYKRSVGSAQHYHKHLQPLIEILA